MKFYNNKNNIFLGILLIFVSLSYVYANNTLDDKTSKTLYGDWVVAEHLKPGMKIMTADNKSVTVHEGWKIKDKKSKTYNLEIKNAHTYFVHNQKIWVHNTCLTRMPELDFRVQFSAEAPNIPGIRLPHHQTVKVSKADGVMFNGTLHNDITYIDATLHQSQHADQLVNQIIKKMDGIGGSDKFVINLDAKYLLVRRDVNTNAVGDLYHAARGARNRMQSMFDWSNVNHHQSYHFNTNNPSMKARVTVEPIQNAIQIHIQLR